MRTVVFILCLFLGLPASAGEKTEESGAALRHDLAHDLEASNPMTAKLIVNIPAKQVELYDQGDLIHVFPVAVGTTQYKTPTGPRALRQIVWNPWWLPPDSGWAKNDRPTPPGPGNPLGIVKLDLGGAILMHGTNKESTVGTPASHGCMRMYREDVKTLAWWIQSRFTEKTDPALLKQYEKNSRTSYYVNLPHSVPVEIKYEVVSIGPKTLKAHPDIYGRAGNLKRHIFSILAQSGYSTDLVSETALNRLLMEAKKRTSEITLKELMPAKLKPSNDRPEDPVEISWKTRQPRKFSFLFDSRFL